MFKVESGPRRLNLNILAYARIFLFFIYSYVPNTTTVTQDTEQSYGPFKTQFIENINTLSDDRIIHNDSTTIKQWMVGIIVFGGIYPESKVELKKSAFEKELSQERNLASWESCGAAPCTRACLDGQN